VSELQGIARFTIREGKLGEFKRLSRSMHGRSRGRWSFTWTSAARSSAPLAHLLTLTTIECYGQPSERALRVGSLASGGRRLYVSRDRDVS
jgi:hypothetical protein